MSFDPEHPALVADVGGTNTRVALADGTRLRPGSIARFRNADHPSLGAVLAKYLAEHNHPDCSAACAAVAGPVEDDVAHLTNLDWQIDCPTLAEAAQAEHVALLNDLQAQGYGVAYTDAERLRPVLDGPDGDPAAPRLVIGVGTGFNIAPILCVDGRHIVGASESGHASLPVQSSRDLALAEFVGATHGYADIEEVLSGRGLENVYAWLSVEAGAHDRIAASEIMRSVEQDADARANETASIFARMLGTVSGDLALIHLPFGGIYFSGGVARALAPHLGRLGFSASFLGKGRFSDLMTRFRISVIEDDFAALAGCAGYLAERRPQ